MSSLKVQVILPLYGGSLPIGRYCAKALDNIGASTRVFDASLLYSAYTGLRRLDLAPTRINALEGGFLRLVSQAIWSQTQEFEPDLVLALAQGPVDQNLLKRMSQAGIKTAMWFVEDYRLFAYWQIYAPLYDVFAVIQKEPFLQKLRDIGQQHALYLPLAALPGFHKQLELTEKEKKEFGSDISFLGAGYPNRRQAFRVLMNRDFKIWGNDWDDEITLKPHLQRPDERIGEEDSVKIYNAAKINLNLHSSMSVDRLISGGDFVNPRTFELAAMGAFQLVDKRSLMPELFDADELATFETLEEMQEKIDYFLQHEEERKAYARRGAGRAAKDHTYEKRMQTLIDYMKANFADWPKARQTTDDLPDLSPEMAEKIVKLTEKLGLGAHAPFDDVVARLRQQSGALDELETSILFLDEWRKQYNNK